MNENEHSKFRNRSREKSDSSAARDGKVLEVEREARSVDREGGEEATPRPMNAGTNSRPVACMY